MKWLREPLVHFLLLGAVLFGLYAVVGDRTGATREQIVVTSGRLESLAVSFTRTWQRPPTQQELDGLVKDFVREEMLYREALAMGLDSDDTIIRRRLAQKVTFLLEDTARTLEPTEEELRRAYEANLGRFQTPARISFTQVYFNRDRRGERAMADATRALEKLSKHGARADTAASGDASLLQQEYADSDEQAVASLFGAEFARAVFALEPGKWHGPIESGYGLHLLRVTEVRKPELRSLAEVRAQVLEEWQREKQKGVEEQYFAGLLKKYEVVVDEKVKPLLGSLSFAREPGR